MTTPKPCSPAVFFAAIALWIWICPNARGTLQSVTSAAAFSIQGTINWGNLGPPTTWGSVTNYGTLVSTPFAMSVSGLAGLTATVNSTSSGDILERADAYDLPNVTDGPRYEAGNFSEGSKLLYVKGTQKPLTFTFNTPIAGFGAQGQATIYGGYEIQMNAYDSADQLLGTFTNAGSFGAPLLGGRTAFLGVLSDTNNIKKVVFQVAGGTGEALYNSPVIQSVTTIPEPSAMVLLVLGAMAVAAQRRQRSRPA